MLIKYAIQYVLRKCPFSFIKFTSCIRTSVFKDKNTPSPFIEDFSILGDDGESARAALPDHVYLDAMGFGMGCCCLQLTFQVYLRFLLNFQFFNCGFHQLYLFYSLAALKRLDDFMTILHPYVQLWYVLHYYKIINIGDSYD